MLLRLHGHLVGLDQNFSILDRSDARSLVERIVKELPVQTTPTGGNGVTHPEVPPAVTPSTPLSLPRSSKSPQQLLHTKGGLKHLLDEISKSKMGKKDIMGSAVEAPGGVGSDDCLLSGLLNQYQRVLQTMQALDFDDLLVYGNKLIRKIRDQQMKEAKQLGGCSSSSSNGLAVRHVLIDEFQDTSPHQYEFALGLNGVACLHE